MKRLFKNAPKGQQLTAQGSALGLQERGNCAL